MKIVLHDKARAFVCRLIAEAYRDDSAMIHGYAAEDRAETLLTMRIQKLAALTHELDDAVRADIMTYYHEIL